MDKYYSSRGWCSPERYVQGPGEFERIRFYTDKFGTKIAVFIDQFFYNEFTEKLKGFYSDERYTLQTHCFNSEVTSVLIDEKAEEVRKIQPDVVIGIGGGKTIDVAKGVAALVGTRFIIVPTAASTDAPTSSLSVIYHSDGSHEGEFFYDHSPSLLIVDSTIIAKAPVRLLVSGMGDALATLVEADATKASDKPNLVYHNDGGYRQSIAGQAIAKVCYESLMKYGVMAKIACENHVVTNALENIIETNILLSGLGFENNATAGAHSVNDGLTAVPGGEKTMHGEKVAFGTIVQLVAENASVKKLAEVTSFCLSVGLPVCLEDLSIDNSDETIRKIAAASMHSCWGNMPFQVDEDTVFAAIKTADQYGRKHKAQSKN